MTDQPGGAPPHHGPFLCGETLRELARLHVAHFDELAARAGEDGVRVDEALEYRGIWNQLFEQLERSDVLELAELPAAMREVRHALISREYDHVLKPDELAGVEAWRSRAAYAAVMSAARDDEPTAPVPELGAEALEDAAAIFGSVGDEFEQPLLRTLVRAWKLTPADAPLSDALIALLRARCFARGFDLGTIVVSVEKNVKRLASLVDQILEHRTRDPLTAVLLAELLELVLDEFGRPSRHSAPAQVPS